MLRVEKAAQRPAVREEVTSGPAVRFELRGWAMLRLHSRSGRCWAVSGRTSSSAATKALINNRALAEEAGNRGCTRYILYTTFLRVPPGLARFRYAKSFDKVYDERV